MSEPEVQPEPEPEPQPEPQLEPQPEPPKRGRGRPRKDPSAPAKKRVVVREPVVREPVVKEPVEQPVEEEDPVNKLARMIMQLEREQRENAMSRYDRLLGFVKKNNATQGEVESENDNETCARDRQVCSGAA